MWHTKLKTNIPMGSTAGQDFHASAGSMGPHNSKWFEGRPRANSAPDTAILGVRKPPAGHSNGAGGVVSSCNRQSPQSPVTPTVDTVDSTCLLPGDGEGSPHPALRSIQNGLPTTAEQKRVARDRNGTGTQQPYTKVYTRAGGGGGGRSSGGGGGGGGMGGALGARRPTRHRQFSVQSRRENFEMKCCRINVLLVIMQMSLGAVVTGLAFYMQTLSPSLAVRECPYWAGIPVSIPRLVIQYTTHLFHSSVGVSSLTYKVQHMFCWHAGSPMSQVPTGLHGKHPSTCSRWTGRHDTDVSLPSSVLVQGKSLFFK